MGISKTDSYTNNQNKLATLAKALGHPARIAIIEYLLKTDSCICGDIVSELPLAQPTVSQHLKALKNAGVIKGNITGTAICYCINEATWAECRALFESLFNKYNLQRKGCC